MITVSARGMSKEKIMNMLTITPTDILDIICPLDIPIRSFNDPTYDAVITQVIQDILCQTNQQQ